MFLVGVFSRKSFILDRFVKSYIQLQRFTMEHIKNENNHPTSSPHGHIRSTLLHPLTNNTIHPSTRSPINKNQPRSPNRNNLRPNPRTIPGSSRSLLAVSYTHLR